MNTPIKENSLVTPFLVFFLVHAMQAGLGLLELPRTIASSAGYDAWISVLIFGFIAHILIRLIYEIMKKSKGDLTWIHQQLFGKSIGWILSFVCVLYWMLLSIKWISVFIEVLKVTMFPELKTWWVALIFILLSYYAVQGGFRTVTGVCFFGVILPSSLLLTLYFPIQFADFRHLLPILDTSVQEIALSTKSTSWGYLGFETLFMYYHFIKQPEKSEKWAHFGTLYTTIIYLAVVIISFAFYTEEQLSRNRWPTLGLFAFLELPFLERFEILGIAIYMLAILPTICLVFWSSSWGVKQLFGMKQYTALIILLVIAFSIVGLFQERIMINKLESITLEIGFYFLVLYIPLLFVLTKIKRRQK
ncbi:GerAB/ArcD/ProY family transporter [Cytobacillus firmus]|nr:GerAB/ArcD/ProY family transporter [Cytobacillus firmus]